MSLPVWKYLPGINTFSYECVGNEMGALTGGTTPASAVWPAANDALFVPLYLYQSSLVTRLYSVNGATVSGNIDMGIYTQNGDRIVSMGSTAQAGTNAPQFFNIADTLLGPGRYYLACALDNGTGTLYRAGLTVIRLQEIGLAKMATAFPLPATATFAVVTSGALPFIGADMGQII